MPKILVADDSRFQAQLLVASLTERGHSVVVAQDTVQAGMLALRELPDAIVLDVNMPGGSGIEVLRRLRRSAKTRNIPIIIVSGSCDSDVANVAMELGAVRFLDKPVNIEQLCETLNWVFSARPAPATPS
jgi:CheY-like chemotaxis protein